MEDDLLARDGYSERPPLLRMLGLALIALIFALIDGPRHVYAILGVAAFVDYGRYLRRRWLRRRAP